MRKALFIISNAIAIALAVWIIISFIEVNQHNKTSYNDDYIYSKYNAFAMITDNYNESR